MSVLRQTSTKRRWRMDLENKEATWRICYCTDETADHLLIRLPCLLRENCRPWLVNANPKASESSSKMGSDVGFISMLFVLCSRNRQVIKQWRMTSRNTTEENREEKAGVCMKPAKGYWPSLLAVWWVGHQHQHHLGLGRNAESQGPVQTSWISPHVNKLPRWFTRETWENTDAWLDLLLI